MFWRILCIVLLICCIMEAFLLAYDNGIASQLVRSAKNVASAQGWRAAVEASLSFIIGKLMDLLKISGKRKKSLDDKLSIAFSPSGGLGDYIISAKLVEEIQGLCECEIDVFCEKEEFGRAVYGGRKDVRVKAYKYFEQSRTSYDAAFLAEHFIHVKNYDERRLSSLSPRLHRKVRYIVDNWDKLYVDIPRQCWRERIQFERCKMLGLDRWTELRMGEAFEIADKKIWIPMDESYAQKWKKEGYGDKKYITVNYGADAMRIGMKQIKMWQRGHYEELVNLLHNEMPEIKTVQLGDANAEKIDGCDKYVFGESLELTKWVLKGSIAHIDCEGGLVHLATQLGTKCIVIFGPTPLHMYGYEENINLKSDKCSNCMGLHEDWAYRCYRGDTAAECMKSVTPMMVIGHLHMLMDKLR